MAIYKDTKLEYRPLTPDMLFYAERKEIRDMGPYYEPDETKSFYDNLILKHKYDLRKKAIKKILKIKQKLYRESGEVL